MATILTHESCDVDDQAQALDGWQQTYEQLGCGRFRGSVWQMVMSEGMLLRERTNRALREQICPPPGHVVLAVPLAVEQGSVFAGRPLLRESLMVLSGYSEYDLVSAGELDLVGIAMRRGALEELLSAGSVEWIDRAERKRCLTLAPHIAAALRHLLLAACETGSLQLDGRNERGRESDLLGAALGRLVALAVSDQGAAQVMSVPRRADTRLRVVQRASAFMRENLHRDIGVPEICAAAFASRRTLQYCFEEFMHTTPQAYLRALRLNEARRALKSRADAPIAEIATGLGFCTASHFTRHYKAMFDELPSQTARSQG